MAKKKISRKQMNELIAEATYVEYARTHANLRAARIAFGELLKIVDEERLITLLADGYDAKRKLDDTRLITK